MKKLLSAYVAFLRSLYLIHQTNHWTSHGDDFYGNHLLFERIYKSAQENSDLAAEKLLGLFGPSIIDQRNQADLIHQISTSLMKKMTGLELSLYAEQKFLNVSRKIKALLDGKSLLSAGLDDAICSIASDRESAVYLIRQALSK